MAGTDLYYASVPLFKNGLQILKNILTKATEHYGPNTPPSDILNATLIEDLRPLVTHVQLCSNISKKSVARMATDLNPEVWEDNEDTVEKLIERCEKTIVMLDGVAPEQVNGREDERVEMQVGPLKMEMSVREQLFHYAIPFFFFHLQFVYSILRMKGVPLGVADFLMPYIKPHLVQRLFVSYWVRLSYTEYSYEYLSSAKEWLNMDCVFGGNKQIMWNRIS